jgi:hypothetical protein
MGNGLVVSRQLSVVSGKYFPLHPAPCPLLLSCSLFSTLKNPAEPGRCTVCQVLANDNYWLISQVKGQAA